jgi:hypothetical protein
VDETHFFSADFSFQAGLCKSWKMVADRLRIEVFYWQPVRYNLLKILALKSCFHSENPRVGSSILSLGTINTKGLRLWS